ncbi:MAG: hypothetical protein U9O94_10460 [Nanoarchaeota archaeon]|nr:hypothetical protein [Nanoarchaeota archaeon]
MTIELKYTIPKINGKEISYDEAAILMGYTSQIESEKKEKTYRTEDEVIAIAKASLKSRIDRENKKVHYTELILNPESTEDFVDRKFQELVSGIVIDLTRKAGINQLADNINTTLGE